MKAVLPPKLALYEALLPLRRYLGYDLIRRARFGYDPFLDIQRLSATWGIAVATFFDVGANDGATARRASVYFPQARIFSFEPHLETFARLVEAMAGRRRF